MISWPDTTLAWIGAIATALSLLFFVLFPIELYRHHRAGTLKSATLKEMLASASPLLPTILIGSVVIAFITALFSGAARLSPWSIETTPLSALTALLLVDFLYYWDHRTAHRFRPYWTLAHSVHHSSPQYDQTTALRVSFVDGFISPWFYLPAVLIGFDPLLVGACLGLILAWQQWLHTEAVGKLKWFDSWLNTPSNHRVHHGVQAQYLDRNYGAVLIVWDRLFGTYARETEPPRYGLVEPIASVNWWTVHTADIGRVIRELRGLPSTAARLRALLWVPRVEL
jgi:sterol desaturase/sphingolipid hydroxylase (fatty acid hydroxylase superfamily)